MHITLINLIAMNGTPWLLGLMHIPHALYAHLVAMYA